MESVGVVEKEPIQLVVVRLEEQRYALHLSAVEVIVRAVEITALPKAPEIVLGIINIRGRIVPVVDIRKRFRLPAREISVNDQLVIAHTAARPVALLVDAVSGVIERPVEEITAAAKIAPGLEYVEGVVKLADGLILIHDLERFLSLEENERLEEALKKI